MDFWQLYIIVSKLHKHTHTHMHTHTHTHTHTYTHTHMHAQTHTRHTGGIRLTHQYKYILTPPAKCSSSCLYYIK